jgi:bifunctional DNA-binding transcriptional regulator/antitoxin component of YhaV-PrlF toxin-antitoxin module
MATLEKLEVEATVRERNQVTIPRQVAERHHIEVGQRLVIVDIGADAEFIVRVLPKSYAGALADVFAGTTDENVDYVRTERATWA